MLIFLYIITALLVLTGLQPLKITGIFFGMCYLPGLTLFALIKKDVLESEDLLLAFPVSIGISSLLTLGLLYMDIHIQFVAYIIYGISGLILLLYMIKHKKLIPLNIRLSSDESTFIVIALLTTLIFSIPVISERISISAHGFHHLSLVTRIFNGIFPPENPGLGGTVIGYHWGYHALIAALSFPTDFHPLRFFAMMNVVSLIFIFGIVYRFAKFFEISKGYRYLVPLALVGLMRSDAIIFYLQKLFSGNFPPLQNSASAPTNLLASWVWGVSYLDTRLFFMSKLYNANNMPLGICIVLSFFLILLLVQEEKTGIAHKRKYMVLLAAVLIALAINYAFFLIIPLFLVPVWAVILFLTNSGDFREKVRESYQLIVPCVIAAVIVFPYLYAITRGEGVITAGKSVSDFKLIYLNVQTIENLIVFLLPLPLIIAGFWVMYRHYAFSRKSLFMMSGTLTCLLLSIFLRIQWSNSAKFSFILSFFFSLLCIIALQHFLSLLNKRWLKGCIIGFAALYFLSAPVLTEAAYIRSPWFHDNTYVFSGRHLLFAQDKVRNGAYSWIRDNTPAESLLMLPYISTKAWNRVAQNISYRPVAHSERSLFIIKDVYAYVSSEYHKRKSIREQFFKDPEDPQVKQYITSLNRPVYLLVEEGFKDPLLEGVEFDQIPENYGEELLLVYKNERQRVYRLYPEN